MVFSSPEFLFGFLAVTIVLYFNPIFKSRIFKNCILLIVSLMFYAWGEPAFVFLMILSIFVTWGIGLSIDRTSVHRKAWLTIGITLHILLLFVFKYLTFICNQTCSLLNVENTFVNIALPIGISFFTFQLMSYLFDVYYGNAPVQKNLLWLALYVSFFPQLIAGPIVRYDQVAEQICNRKETREDFTFGMQRFLFGMAKKLLLSNYLAQIADNIFTLSASTQVSVMGAWLGAVSYTLQIYFDFSGYSDMAIGLGQIFGFHFPENFNYPYISGSVTEFWRRWHISLGTWFRDYVYIPLGGNRGTKSVQIKNMFIVWLLTGIWHGANWTFVVWGLFYFFLLLIEKYTPLLKYCKRFSLSHIYTIFMVMIGWVIFRADTLAQAFHYLGNMFGLTKSSFVDPAFWFYMSSGKVILIMAVLLSMPLYPWARKKYAHMMEIADPVILLSVAVLVLISVVATTYNPFIYFNF